MPTAQPGTSITERNVATMQVSGPARSRVLVIRAFDTEGNEQWNRTRRADELR